MTSPESLGFFAQPLGRAPTPTFVLDIVWQQDEGQQVHQPDGEPTPSLELETSVAQQDDSISSPGTARESVRDSDSLLDIRSMTQFLDERPEGQQDVLAKILQMDQCERTAADTGARSGAGRRVDSPHRPSNTVVRGLHYLPTTPRPANVDGGSLSIHATTSNIRKPSGVDPFRMRAILQCRRSTSTIVQFIPQADGQSRRTEGRREYRKEPILHPPPSSAARSGKPARPSTAHVSGAEERRRNLVGSPPAGHRPKSAMPLREAVSPFRGVHDQATFDAFTRRFPGDTTFSQQTIAAEINLFGHSMCRPSDSQTVDRLKLEALHRKDSASRRRKLASPVRPWKEKPTIHDLRSPLDPSFMLTTLKKSPSFQEKPSREFGSPPPIADTPCQQQYAAAVAASHSSHIRRAGASVNVSIPWSVPFREASLCSHVSVGEL